MGELHLEIVEERLRRVYRVPCHLGQLQVAYREGLLQEAEATCESLCLLVVHVTATDVTYIPTVASVEQAFSTSLQSVVATVTLTPEDVGNDVTFNPGVAVEEEQLALRSAVESSLARGTADVYIEEPAHKHPGGCVQVLFWDFQCKAWL